MRELQKVDYLDALKEEPKKRTSVSWAEGIKMIFELDPLECPKCGARMKIKAFIKDENEVERFATNLGYKKEHPPPLINTKSEVVYDDLEHVPDEIIYDDMVYV